MCFLCMQIYRFASSRQKNCCELCKTGRSVEAPTGGMIEYWLWSIAYLLEQNLGVLVRKFVVLEYGGQVGVVFIILVHNLGKALWMV